MQLDLIMYYTQGVAHKLDLLHELADSYIY